MPTEAPSSAEVGAPAEALLRDLNPGYLVTPMRIGAALVIAFQLACMLVGPYQARPAPPVTVPLHVLNLLVGAAILCATYTRTLSTHWRSLGWWSCCALMVSTAFIGVADKRPALMF